MHYKPGMECAEYATTPEKVAALKGLNAATDRLTATSTLCRARSRKQGADLKKLADVYWKAHHELAVAWDAWIILWD